MGACSSTPTGIPVTVPPAGADAGVSPVIAPRSGADAGERERRLVSLEDHLELVAQFERCDKNLLQLVFNPKIKEILGENNKLVALLAAVEVYLSGISQE